MPAREETDRLDLTQQAAVKAPPPPGPLPLTMVLEAKQVGPSEEVERREPMTARGIWISPPPAIKTDLCAGQTNGTSPVSPVTTTDTDSESERDLNEQNEAASILSSVVKPEKGSTLPPSEAPKVLSTSAAAAQASQYEDLLDCLASLASGRAPLEPLDRRVARMSVDDIDVRTGGSSDGGGSATTSSTDMVVDTPAKESAPVDRPPARRPRAVSNPEGCEVWRRIEIAAKKADEEQQQLQAAATASGPGPSAANTSAAAATVSPTLPHMLAKYANIYNKNGRIGIYTRDERDAIIRRFREKRSRRVWAKKIRYTCRKSLADKRIRVKGRFVKLEDMEAILEQQDKEKLHSVKSGGALDVLTMIAERSAHEDVDDEEEDEAAVEEEEELPTTGKRMRRHSIAF